MATEPLPRFTLEQYLALERQEEGKSEYHNGEIFSMSGGTELHARLSFRIAHLLELYLKGMCRVYGSDLKIYLEKQDLCVYPDAMAICGEPEFLDQRNDVIKNPSLIVEVLSPSTASYDKARKSIYYRDLPSLQHCLLIEQDQVYVEHSARHENGTWLLNSHTSLDRTITLSGLSVSIPVSEIYTGILRQ